MERARILIVDDHAEVILGLRQLIETDEASEVVGEATSAGQAVERARKLRPDIVLMDFSMGDMDGLEAASLIREENPSTEVVILSVYEADEHEERVRQAGVRRWIPKSQPPDVLLQELHELAGELHQRL
ncbi:MAG TPA: response regulator transcription factor [Coriobacteriia bacterium]